jgi:hypothetical protein
MLAKMQEQIVGRAMKKIAISMVFAITNLILIGVLLLGRWWHIGVLPSALLPLIIIPCLVLASVVFALRDILRPSTRWQAVLALMLSVPIAYIYFTTSF